MNDSSDVAAARRALGARLARLRQEAGHTQCLGPSDVARLNAVMALYRSMDSEFGSGVLYRDVAGLAESASSMLDRARFSCPGALAPSLPASVAAARQLAGWTAFDTGRHADAQRHLLAAERAALAADDFLLAANVRYCQARQFQHLRHHRDAVDTLRLARDQLGVRVTAAVSARLYGTEATSLAALGQGAEAVEALKKAREEFDRIEIEREPDWIRFYDNGELFAEHATVHRHLARFDAGHGPAALRWYSEAIAAFGPQQARSSVLNSTTSYASYTPSACRLFHCRIGTRSVMCGGGSTTRRRSQTRTVTSCAPGAIDSHPRSPISTGARRSASSTLMPPSRTSSENPVVRCAV